MDEPAQPGDEAGVPPIVGEQPEFNPWPGREMTLPKRIVIGDLRDSALHVNNCSSQTAYAYMGFRSESYVRFVVMGALIAYDIKCGKAVTK